MRAAVLVAVMALVTMLTRFLPFIALRKRTPAYIAYLGRVLPELGKPLGEALLTPTKIYVKPVLAVLAACDIRGISHITGGGFYENIPRSIPDGLGAKIAKSAVRTPEIFRLIEKTGGISERDMFNTFNMGVGMSLIAAPEDADRAVRILKDMGEDAYVIGEIVSGEEKITLC